MLSLLVTVALLRPQATPAAAPEDLSQAEKVYGLSLFWKEAKDNFVFFDKVPDLDWDKAYQEFIPKVLATKSTGEYYDQLTRFCALLRDSHTEVYRPKGAAAKPQMTPPIGALTVKGKSWIGSVPKSLAAEVPLKSEIVAVEGKPPMDYFRETWLPVLAGTERQVMQLRAWQLLMKPKGEVIHFTIQTPQGVRKQVEVAIDIGADFYVTGPDGVKKRIVTEKDKQGIPIYENATKPYGLDMGAWAPAQYKDLGNGIAYVKLNTFIDMKTAEQFESFIPELKKAKGIVIDMRGNGGGNDTVGIRIARHFTRSSFKGNRSMSKESVGAFRAWGKFVDPAKASSDWEKMVLKHYRGEAWRVFEPDTIEGSDDAELLMPKVVLVDGSTASAAEDTLIYFSQINNFTSVGQATFGGTGQPYTFDLPGGGSARICVHRVTLPDGKDFVGPGITPDIVVDRTLDDIWEGRDPIFTKGLEILKSKITTK